MKQILPLLILLLLTIQARGDVLLIERVAAKDQVNLPQKSTTMNQVRTAFGDPLMMSEPVGNPPITRWEYADFVVYFEHQHVITTVLKKSKTTESGPRPKQ